MARGRNVQDPTILQMALVGYQVEIEKIEARIHEVQSLLKGKPTGFLSGAAESEHSPVKRVLSDEARNRIAAAQRKRWAKHRRLKAQGAKAK
jgi:hypothetical protein